MPKCRPHPKYTNSQITELIKEHIHDELDQKILYLKFVKGKTNEAIAETVGRDTKTVYRRLRKNENELFSNLPG